MKIFRQIPKFWRAAGLAGLLWLLFPSETLAHVKWFANFSFADEPQAFGQILTPIVLGLAGLSAVVIGGLVPLDRYLNTQGWYQRFNQWLEGWSGNSLLVMRVGTGAVMLMVWQTDAMLAPELPIAAPWIGWLQFFIALTLIFERTTPVGGLGVLFLYLLGVSQYGLFHMLDYVHYVGVGIFLVVATLPNKWLRGIGLPALYSAVGVSLMWLALEKLVYPDWGAQLLLENPQLALGLPSDFFLASAAFVELSLGFLLIICLLERPLSLVITLVFFMTTLIFGRTEVVGHTLLHAALVVFVIEGPGRIYSAPITFHKRIPLRVAFASVNFLLFVGVLLGIYTYSANAQYQAFLAQTPVAESHDTATLVEPPALGFALIEAAGGGYNLQLELTNFELVNPDVPELFVPGEGYAELLINGDSVARLYDDWYYIPDLRPGVYQITVVLNGSDNGAYTVNGSPVAATQTLVVE